jgi:hypothetical protein
VTGKPRDTRIYFPFYEKGENIKNSRGYKLLQETIPDAATFIENEIKPGFDCSPDLYAVSHLDNIDKHNFILPIVAVTEIVDLYAVDGEGGLHGTKHRFDAAYPKNIFSATARRMGGAKRYPSWYGEV